MNTSFIETIITGAWRFINKIYVGYKKPKGPGTGPFLYPTMLHVYFIDKIYGTGPFLYPTSILLIKHPAPVQFSCVQAYNVNNWAYMIVNYRINHPKIIDQLAVHKPRSSFELHYFFECHVTIWKKTKTYIFTNVIFQKWTQISF